jgi:sporulation protein YtfJ
MANSIGNMMSEAMDKIRSMVDANTVVGAPITTADGVTLIPVSRVAFGFASGGNDASASANRPNVWGGSGAAVKVEPIGFLMIKDGSARMVSIQPPAFSTTDRLIDLVPEVMDKVESYVDKYSKKSREGQEIVD